MATWTDLVHKFLGHAKYNATLPTYTDGQTAEMQADSRGRLRTVLESITGVATSTTAGTTWVDSYTADDSGTISASPKALLGAYFTSTYAASGFIQLHNLAAHGSLSSGATVPLFSIPIDANGFAAIDLPRGRAFSTGIVWAFSSTANVYTAVAAATVVGSAEYI